MNYLLIPITAFINRLRGWGPTNKPLEVATSKYVCSVYLGLISFLLTFDWVVGGIVALGYAIWAMRGWGDYFDFSDRPNNEIQFIDGVTQHDTIAMSLRGFVFSLPLFLSLVGYNIYLGTFEWVQIVTVFTMLLQGPIYLLGHTLDKDDVRGIKTILAEVLTGAVMGLAIALNV